MQFPVHLIPKKVAAYLNILKMGNTFFFLCKPRPKSTGAGVGLGLWREGGNGKSEADTLQAGETALALFRP